MIPYLFSPINLSKPPPSIIQRSHLFFTRDSDLLPCLSMESFSLPKLWKSPTAGFGTSLSVAAADRCLVSVVEAVEEEEESFFELEFTLPDYDDGFHEVPVGEKIGRIGDFISGEKPDRSRIRSKPQSPMSILKQSAPKLRIFMFGKAIKRSKPEKSSSQPHSDSSGSRRKTRINFTVKLRIEDPVASKKKFGRSESSNGGGKRDLDGFCRKFSKDSVHKYLNLIKKPLNTNSNSKRRDSFDSASTASFSSPRKSEERACSNGRFGVPVKSLGKSRSAGALLVGASLTSALDDSLKQQNDGIQGAILHCKQSFNSSPKERRMMSRCASDTSNEKSFQRTE